MSLYSAKLTALATLSAVLPAVQAHIALFHPSSYGFNQPRYDPIQPLSDKSFTEWWFHGNIDDRPSEVMTIPAGRNLSVELTCGKQYSSWGSESSEEACPTNSGSYHAGGWNGGGWNGNSEENLMGCALAIAYKSDAHQVQPEDFTVFSIQEDCVRRRNTTFAVPANLPECPNGECVCAWFWQGQISREEMYMTGFRCRVEGGVADGAIPHASAPHHGSRISGPTQPVYWSNDRSNIDFNSNWNDRPSYNSRFGWVDGAQTSAFGTDIGRFAANVVNSTYAAVQLSHLNNQKRVETRRSRIQA